MFRKSVDYFSAALPLTTLHLCVAFFGLSSCTNQYRFTSDPNAVEAQTLAPAAGGVTPNPNGVPSSGPSSIPSSTPPNNGTPITETFTGSSIDRKVDLIFVVDSSGSMENVQNQLTSNLDFFIQDFLTKSIDFRIGVITTDTFANKDDQGNSWTDRYSGFINPARGCFMTKYKDSSGQPIRYISSNTKDLAKTFSQNATVGIHGSGIEKGLHSLSYALSADLLKAGGCNAGFVREKSLLSVVVISDENENLEIDDGDNNPRGEPLPELRIARVRGILDHLKTDKRYRLDFVINSSYADTSTVTYPLEPPGGVFYNPDFYLIAAKAFHSKVYDIKTPKFGSQLAEIGSDIANEVRADFHLASIPDVSTIKVTIDGTVITSGPNGYLWIADKGVVHLQGKALEMSDRRTVKITYKAK